MIYAYKYLPHRIEGFHTNIAYFFEQLFANDLAVYDETILLQADFIPIIRHSSKLIRYLTDITTQYHSLPNLDKKLLKKALVNNCNIEDLCNNIGSNEPIKYAQISDATFRELLKEFLTELWDYFLSLDSVCNYFGSVQEHFSVFVSDKHQKALICPFCGLCKLKTSESINRDAYDHYIPKALYPFTSINFKNLFPICHECNSDEKKATDTLYSGLTRRPVFYPFDTTYQVDQLEVKVEPINTYNPVNLKTLLYDIDWDYVITHSGKTDPRINSWDKIFHIKRRYRENILVYQTEWYEEVLRKFKKEKAKGRTFNEFRAEIMEDSEYMRLISPFGVLRHTYFQFLFSISEIELILNETNRYPPL